MCCKAPYLNTNDSRVQARLEEDQWSWYHRAALRTVIQACGRVVRAPDDYGDTYLADSSLLDLFERARADTPDWFAEQVDRMTTPDLPEFDPEAALAGHPDWEPRSTRGGASGSRRRTNTRTSGSTSGSTSGRSGAKGTGSSGNGGGPSGSASETGSEKSDDERSNHPLSDVWGN